MERIGHDFATDTIEIGPLCFFQPEQQSLGRLAIERVSGQYGSEFATVSFPEFIKHLKDIGYLEKGSVHSTIELFKKAKNISDLPDPVKKRMAFVQNHLVKLLIFLEGQGNVTFFVSEKHKERKTADHTKYQRAGYTGNRI